MKKNEHSLKNSMSEKKAPSHTTGPHARYKEWKNKY
jgi:hypothetical protein